MANVDILCTFKLHESCSYQVQVELYGEQTLLYKSPIKKSRSSIVIFAGLSKSTVCALWLRKIILKCLNSLALEKLRKPPLLGVL